MWQTFVMLHIWAVLLHSKALTAAEKSSGLLDDQPSLQFPEINIVPLAPLDVLVYIHHVKTFWTCSFIGYQLNKMCWHLPSSLKSRSPRAIYCASNLPFDTALTRLRIHVWVMNFQSHTWVPSCGSQRIQGQYTQGWLHIPLGHNWRRMLNSFLNK